MHAVHAEISPMDLPDASVHPTQTWPLSPCILVSLATVAASRVFAFLCVGMSVYLCACVFVCWQ